MHRGSQISSRVYTALHLFGDVESDQWLSILMVGLVAGTVSVTVAVAFAALIFSGGLSPYISDGIGIMLVGSMVITAVGALISSFDLSFYSLQDSPVAITALITAVIAQEMPSAGRDAYYTAVAAVALGTLLTGAVMFGLGHFKLGNLVRFIPYPVVGGFLAATGLLLVSGGVSVMTGLTVDLKDLSPVLEAEALAKWLPGMGLAVLLILILRRRSSALILPGILLGTIVLFYVVLWAAGSSVADAKDHGWLLNALPAGGGKYWNSWSLSNLKQIDWSVLGRQSISLGATAVISVIAMLLNASGLELISQKNVDLDRELKSCGIANLAAGLAGSSAGFHVLSTSVLARKSNLSNRLPGLIEALLCGSVLVAGSRLLTCFPNFVLGGLVFFLGLDLLISWVYETWFKLPKTEYAIVILILVVINWVGFLEGIGLGILVSIILFVLNYSRIQVVKQTLTGGIYHSNVVRPSLYQQLLRAKGDWIYILKLQGFIFFGTATTLLDQVRERVSDPQNQPPRFVVLDFRLVTGLDSSAVLSFARMKQLATTQSIQLIFTHLSPGVQRQLKSDVLGDDTTNCRVFPDLDHGIEWCENQSIQVFESVGLAARPKTLMQQLTDALPNCDDLSCLMQYFDRQSVDSGYYLMTQGDSPKGMYFIESGKVTVLLELGGGQTLRLRRMDAGTIVGELGTYLSRPATASVVASEASTLYFLSTDSLHKMETDHPELATAFHRFMAHFMAERLVHTTETLQALVD